MGPLDLKLLVAFDAVMQERSVSRAAKRLGMSQPALSSGLGRLRLLLNDNLFVRTTDGMRPTDKALQLAGPISAALKQIQKALEAPLFSSCAAPDWSFGLAVSDQASVVILPRLLRLLRRIAPRIRLKIEMKNNLTVHTQLDAGQVDIAIGILPKLPRRFEQIVLFQDHYVCMMHRTHPLAGKTLTLEEFKSAEHLALWPSLDASSEFDKQLKHLGVARSVILNVSQFLAVPALLAQAPLMVCMLATVAEQFSRTSFPLSPMPFPAEPMNVVMAWSRARTDQPANLWMRRRLTEACSALSKN